MTEAERALLLFVAEKLATLLHNARWPDAGELMRLKRIDVLNERRAAEKQQTGSAPAQQPRPDLDANPGPYSIIQHIEGRCEVIGSTGVSTGLIGNFTQAAEECDRLNAAWRQAGHESSSDLGHG